MSDYNTTCRKCGADAYQGLGPVKCSNGRCEDAERPEPSRIIVPMMRSEHGRKQIVLPDNRMIVDVGDVLKDVEYKPQHIRFPRRSGQAEVARIVAAAQEAVQHGFELLPSPGALATGEHLQWKAEAENRLSDFRGQARDDDGNYVAPQPTFPPAFPLGERHVLYGAPPRSGKSLLVEKALDEICRHDSMVDAVTSNRQQRQVFGVLSDPYEASISQRVAETVLGRLRGSPVLGMDFGHRDECAVLAGFEGGGGGSGGGVIVVGDYHLADFSATELAVMDQVKK